MTQSKVKVYVAVRYQGTSVSGFCRQGEKILNAVSHEAKLSLPLHWIFNLYPLLKPLQEHTGSAKSLRGLNDLVLEIKTRVKTTGDRVWPSGFRGTCHPFLHPDELGRELSWCRENPWTPNMVSLFGERGTTIFPIHPDPWREIAAGSYAQAGFNYVGIPVNPGSDSSNRQRKYHLFHQTPSGGFLCYIPWSGSKDKASTIRRFLDPEDRHLLILLNLNSSDDDLAGIGELAQQMSIECSTLDEEMLTSKSRGPQSLTDFAGDTGVALAARAPQWGLRSRHSQSLRRKKNKDDKVYRAILDSMAEDNNVADNQKLAAQRPGSILIAEMAGSIQLAGPVFSAHFKRGRLMGLSKGRRRLGTGIPAGSYFTVAGQPVKFRLESAFSFESEAPSRTGQSATGLRSVFRVVFPPAGSPARLSVDSYFYEKRPGLYLDLNLSLPEWFQDFDFGAFVPLEIPLLILEKDNPEVRVAFSDDSEYTVEIDNPFSVLRGKSFLFLGPQIRFQYEGSEPENLAQLLIRHRGRRRVLCLNPFGSYRPVKTDAFNGQQIEYSCSLHAE